MRVGNFSVIVPQGRERSEGHVAMQHDARYTIKMVNHGHKRCDALVKVDGKDMGGFRLDGGESFTLERPSHDKGCFTFYKSGTEEFQAATAGKVGKDERGLIQVTFKPEKQARPVAKPLGAEACLLRDADAYKGTEEDTGGSARSFGASKSKGTPRLSTDDLKGRGFGSSPGLARKERVTSGATGLSGESGQQFITVSALDHAPGEEVTITLRLVCVEPAVRELTAAPRANPVPAPVD